MRYFVIEKHIHNTGSCNDDYFLMGVESYAFACSITAAMSDEDCVSYVVVSEHETLEEAEAELARYENEDN